jgi:hypothetical protein
LAFPCQCLHRPASSWKQLPPLRSYRPCCFAFEDSAPLSAPGWCGPCRVSHRSDCRFQAPLLGFLKDRPSIVLPVCPLLASQGPRLPRLERVPPLSFFPTSAVYSTQGLAGLLHPANDHGVHPVSSRLPTCRAETRPPYTRLFPQVLCPSKCFPLRQRIPCHQGAYPLAVGSATTEVTASPQPRGFVPP